MGQFSNETRYAIVIEPDGFVFAIELAAYVSLVLLLYSYFLVVWLCLAKSPSSMSGYRWFILVNATNAVIFETFFTLVAPEPLLPYPLLLVGGPLRNVYMGETMNTIYVQILVFLGMANFQTTMLQFLYRYCQTVNNWLYTRVLSNTKLTMTMIFLTLILPGVLVMTPVCFLVEPRNALLEHMQVVDPKVHTKMSDRNMIGFIRHGAEHIYMFAGGAAFLFGGITVTIIFFSTFGCYNHLRKRKDLFSSRTMSLYWTLITALVIDMFSGAILVLMPSFFVGLSFLYGAKHASILTSIAMRTICLYHIVANVVLICAVRPYREAVSSLFIQILSCKKSPITSRSNKVFDRPSRPTSAQPQIVGFEGNSRFFTYAQ